MKTAKNKGDEIPRGCYSVALFNPKTKTSINAMPGASPLRFLMLALSLGLGFSTAFAQAGPKPGSTAGVSARIPAVIGVVNIQDAIIATNEGKKEFDALQARFAPQQNSLKALNDEVENMKKDLQAKADKLNQTERAKQLQALEEKQKTLQRNYEDAQAEFQQAEQEVVNRIGAKMLNVMEKYAKDNGYTMIIDVSDPKTPVLWAVSGTNITKDLVDAYNAESPTAPASNPSGAATKPALSLGGTVTKKP